jgi:tRNA (guanosine-2'-O-)-methyltransferase
MHDPDFLNFVRQFLTPERQQRFAEVLEMRTRRIAVVLENLFQTHNASACLRSCDAFGIQDVHIVENTYEYDANEEIDMGASRWLTLKRYDRGAEATAQCLSTLKDDGYRIVATSLHHEAHTPESLPLDEPLAVVFGGERPGISKTVVEMADEFLKIPMTGFVQSLNVSVATAIILQRLTDRLRTVRDDWQLSEDEKRSLIDDWTVTSVKKQHPRVVQTWLHSRKR